MIKRIAIPVIVLLGFLYLTMGRQDLKSAIVTEKIVEESPLPFTHPLAYDTTVTQSGQGIREPRTHYYAKRER